MALRNILHDDRCMTLVERLNLRALPGIPVIKLWKQHTSSCQGGPLE